MSEQVTARLGLPLMAAGQAQKEVTHNEALLLIDAVTLARVEAGPQSTPPTSPAVGQCWLVGPAPTGAWSGKADMLASWTTGGWRFVAIPPGGSVIIASSGARYQRISSGWQAPATIAVPTGGAVADSECRSALAAIISALSLAGLIIAG